MIACIQIHQFYSLTAMANRHLPFDAAAAVHQEGVLICVNSGAETNGLLPGMTVREAKSTLPQAHFIQYADEEYQDAARGWLDLALEMSSLIEVSEPNTAFIDLSGHGSPEAVLTRWSGRLEEELGMRAKFGLAADKGAAALAAAAFDIHEFELGMRGITLHPDKADSVCGGQELNANYPHSAAMAEVRFEGGIDDCWALSEGLAAIAKSLKSSLSAQDACGRLAQMWIEFEDGSVEFHERFGSSMSERDSIELSLGTLLDRSILDRPVTRIRVILPDLAPMEEKGSLPEITANERVTPAEQALRHIRAVFGEQAVLAADAVPTERRGNALRIWRSALSWR